MVQPHELLDPKTLEQAHEVAKEVARYGCQLYFAQLPEKMAGGDGPFSVVGNDSTDKSLREATKIAAFGAQAYLAARRIILKGRLEELQQPDEG